MTTGDKGTGGQGGSDRPECLTYAERQASKHRRRLQFSISSHGEDQATFLRSYDELMDAAGKYAAGEFVRRCCLIGWRFMSLADAETDMAGLLSRLGVPPSANLEEIPPNEPLPSLCDREALREGEVEAVDSHSSLESEGGYQADPATTDHTQTNETPEISYNDSHGETAAASAGEAPGVKGPSLQEMKGNLLGRRWDRQTAQ
ncbi:hypothetical protein [Stenotrophomonas maltophilia]|uniref:hypothetical protein n=1 Tax=Stenotrophomonas maltophilia TaxID=40324 RepID=UPI002557331A|nr:hypothetical protein [Stenotrophomonas maltophilia]